MMEENLAQIAASLYTSGKKDLAADLVLLVSKRITASKNTTHVLMDDSNTDSVFMKTLHKMLGELGFSSILRTTKERAAKLLETPNSYYSKLPGTW